MDITELVKKDKEQEQDKLNQDDEDISHIQNNFYVIPEDAGFLSDIDELTRLLHKSFAMLYSDPSKVTAEKIQNAGAMLAILDKYADTRKNIYMMTKTKQKLTSFI